MTYNFICFNKVHLPTILDIKQTAPTSQMMKLAWKFTPNQIWIRLWEMKYAVGAVRLKCSVNDCSKTNSSHCCSTAVKLNKLQSRHCSAMHSPLTRIFLLSSIRHHSTNADFSAFQMSPFVSVWDFLIWNWELRDLIFKTLTKLSTVFVVQFISFVNKARNYLE